jgi:hypothetical protein
MNLVWRLKNERKFRFIIYYILFLFYFDIESTFGKDFVLVMKAVIDTETFLFIIEFQKYLEIK